MPRSNIDFVSSSGGGAPSGPAGGSLAGTYPNPTFAGRDTSVDEILKDLLPQLLTETVGVYTVPLTVTPNSAAGGSLAGTYPNPTFAGRDTSTDAINKDLLPQLLTEVIGAYTVPASVTPNSAAGGSLAGTYPNPTFAGRDTSVDAILKDLLPATLALDPSGIFSVDGRKVTVQVFVSSGTYIKPLGAQTVLAIVMAAGGGGASGRKGAAASIRQGGGGGAAGSWSVAQFRAIDLTSSVTVTIGAGGPGGAQVTADNTNGNAGTNGGDTSFGTYITALGGQGGQPGTAIDGPGGAGLGTNVLQWGNVLNIAANGGNASAAGTGTAGANGTQYGGGGGGGGGGLNGANTRTNGTAGGGGGGVTGTLSPASILAGGTAGTVAGAAGGAGTAGGTSPASSFAGAGGGGGAAGGDSTGATPGGQGGAAGAFGAGGGGGGGATNTATAAVGAKVGGAGSGGFCIVLTYT